MRVGQNETAAEQTWPRANTGGRRGSPYTPRGGGLRRRIHSSIVYSYNTEQNDIMHEQAVNLKSWKNMLLTPRVTFLFITLPRRWDVATGQQQQNVICFLFLSLFLFFLFFAQSFHEKLHGRWSWNGSFGRTFEETICSRDSSDGQEKRSDGLRRSDIWSVMHDSSDLNSKIF